MNMLFSSDQPITHISEDRLGRGSYILRLVKAIKNWSWNESIVIGLQGEWGTGKTSIVNLLLNEIENEVTVVKFSPWSWSNSEWINRRFFKVLFTSGGFSESKIKQASEYIELLSGFNAKVGIVARLTKKVLKRWVKYDNSLEDLKTKICVSIEDSEKKFLVVIDDLDRLTPDEVLEVFKLVKCNADFSNIIYLMVYQRDVILKHLNTVCFNDNAEEYLKKIVQIPLDIPSIEQQRMHGILEDSLGNLTKDIHLDVEDELRISDLFYSGLIAVIRNLRDLKRFEASIRFSKFLHESESGYEVNIVDVIALEALRVFNPDVIVQIVSNRKMLTGTQIVVNESDRVVMTKQAKTLLNSSEEAKSLLQVLFPDIQSVAEGKDYSWHSSIDANTFLKRRMCHKDMFDRYLVMSIPENDVPITQMTNFIQHLYAEHNLINYLTNDNLESILYRMHNYLEEKKHSIGPAYIRNMLQLGDIVSDTSRGVFIGSPFDRVCYCLKKSLNLRYTSTTERASKLSSIFHNSHSYAVIARYLNTEWWARQEDKKGQVSSFDGKAYEGIISDWLESLSDFSIENPMKLLRIPALHIILIQWEKESGELKGIEKWQGKMRFGETEILSILRAFQKQTSRGTRICLQDLYHFFDESMKSRIHEILLDDLTDEEIELIRAFKISSNEKKSGV